MKNKLPIIAILAVSSQFALADAANDAQFNGAAAANEPASVTATAGTADEAQEDKANTTSKLAPLNIEVGSSLQSKLDAQMEFQLGPQLSHDQEIASVN